MRFHSTLLLCAIVVATNACSDSTTENDPEATEFVVRGSTSATATAAGRLSNVSSTSLVTVNATSFTVKLAEMRVSLNTDCSGPYATVFTHTTPTAVDLVATPEIARVTGLPAGTYPCVALRISDIIGYTPEAAEGACVAGTAYSKDIYRIGNETVPFLDIAGTVTPATGTDAVPGEDIIWVFFSTNEAAVTGRGYSPSQVNALNSPLTIPGSTVFYWEGTNAIVGTAAECDIQPRQIGFR